MNQRTSVWPVMRASCEVKGWDGCASGGALLAEEVVEDAPLNGCETGVAPMPRTRRIHRQIEADAPSLDDENAVGERHRFRNVVGDEHGREPLPQPHALQKRLHVDAGQRIEGAERFVEREQLRAADQRARERDSWRWPPDRVAGQFQALSRSPT